MRTSLIHMIRFLLILTSFLTIVKCKSPGPIVPSRPDSIDTLTNMWLKGRIDLVADESTVGFIAVNQVGETDVYWIMYFASEEELDVYDHVFFKLYRMNISGTSHRVVFAENLTSTLQADSCTADCIDEDWLKGSTVIPHHLFSHEGGGTLHRPGHIINSSPSGSVETRMLTIFKDGVAVETQEYQVVQVEYDSGDTERIFVPKDLVPVLSDPTREHYLDFYDTLIDTKRVLRSYSITHDHPGHVSNITIGQ